MKTLSTKIIDFTFIFRARVKPSYVAHNVCVQCCGNHSIASWDVVTDGVSFGCMLEIFTKLVYHPGNSWLL